MYAFQKMNLHLTFVQNLEYYCLPLSESIFWYQYFVVLTLSMDRLVYDRNLRHERVNSFYAS